jgi:hypothetical protein
MNTAKLNEVLDENFKVSTPSEWKNIWQLTLQLVDYTPPNENLRCVTKVLYFTVIGIPWEG